MGSVPAPQFYNIINDEKRVSAKVHQVTDPRTEEPLWDCPIASTNDLEDAITAANKAFITWRDTTVGERQKLLVKMGDMIKEHEVELMEILMKETGKSKLLATIEIQNTIGQCMYYAKTALEDKVQFEDETVKIIATHLPLGVVGAICPWNFPLILCNIKVVSALVTGNCVIVKPSPFTPYCVMRWIELCIGLFPPGVLQVVNGGADLGALMTLHPGIHKISFTGTIATGKKVMESCSKTLKKVTLELAGNNAAIVLPDVDIEKVAAQTASGSFFNAGQVCVATKRVYVHKDIYDAFLEKFLEETKKNFVVTEDGAVPTPFGPVSNKMQFDIVKKILEDAKTAGGKIVAGGEGYKGKGFWVEPTVVSQPPEDSMLVKEEQFGPIIPILSWSTEDDVISRANLHNAGLGATVYSKDISHAEKIARRLEAGSVWINMNEKPNPAAWFAGFKDSGFGGEMGKQGLLSYAYTKSIHFAKSQKVEAPPSPKTNGNGWKFWLKRRKS